MSESSVGSGVSGGMGRSMRCGMDKRKVCVFLILVAIALVCIVLMAYMLFYASPHANTTIQGGHSSLRLERPASVRG